MSKRVFIKTWGCQMNEHDAERMAGLVAPMGYEMTPDAQDADLILLNTCSIREKAEQKVYSDLGRLAELKASRPHVVIGVAGCVAQQEGEALIRRAPSVDLVFGSKGIEKLPELLSETLATGRKVVYTDDPIGIAPTLPADRRDAVRAWVSIMEGCENACSFCVVPATRGRERSRLSREVFEEVAALSARGCREVTLLGQNVNSYGRTSSEDADFADLLELIHPIEGLERIRFTTSHPNAMTPKLIDALARLPKVCRHLHLPLQAGSDRTLERMRRGYSLAEYVSIVDALRRRIPDLTLTTDIIVGFPGETQEDFADTLRALRAIEFDNIYAFKYSRRPRTEAVTLDLHVPEPEKDRRLQETLAVQRPIARRQNERFLGRSEEVLVEGPSKTDRTRLAGRTSGNRIVNFDGPWSLIGRLVPLDITRVQANSLEGALSA
ncbi:MAG TPA: tRNA (N6-isopentenyl adenosine(37)-C2)-methylthiotransferase MiaB [Nitrospiria bacterium]|nr:tRNA (N6-isopentenyl adenosine(37)-C2)-methylthiotransferase MiaB [Nitrospiria bacterium]